MDTLERRPLILAPAGSLAAVDAVLSAGAGAVYIGAPGGLSRGGLAGIPMDAVGDAADRCRRAGVRLHAAVNSVPVSGEVPSFLSVLSTLARNGVSEIILNDPGMIALVRREFPGLPICASVGLSAMNPQDAVALRELGAGAVVLPSAVRPGAVPSIKRASGLRIEVFAWCRAEFLLHGRCGLTGYAAEDTEGGTASAKRGKGCRRVCRCLPVPREPHSLEDDLPSWIRAGTDVFKIEGRDLSPEALKSVVERFRRRLDAALDGSAAG